MVIKILGSGCAKCKKLAVAAEEAVKTSGIEASIEKVTEINEIMDYGVMMTPALVIDEKVVSTGKVLKPQQIVTLLQK
jgi:small redox-active disulfide protein 2